MSGTYGVTVERNGPEAGVTLGIRLDLEAVAAAIAARRLGRLARETGAALSDNPYAGKPYDLSDCWSGCMDWVRWVNWRVGWTKGQPPGRAVEDEAVDLTVGAGGVAVSAFSQERGSRWLRQHVEIDYAETNLDGESRRVARVRDLLAILHGRGEITLDELRGGRAFARAFYQAQLDAGRAADLEWTASGNLGGNLADSVLDARAEIARMIDAVGGHRTRKAAAVWFCIGCNEAVSAFARRVLSGQARALNDHVAKGVLLAALECLVEFAYESG